MTIEPWLVFVYGVQFGCLMTLAVYYVMFNTKGHEFTARDEQGANDA